MIALTWVLLQAVGGDFEGTLWRGPEVIGQVQVSQEGPTRTLRTTLDAAAGASEWVEVQTVGDRPGRATQIELRFTPGPPPSAARELRVTRDGNAVLLVLEAVQQRIRVDHSAWFLHHREHLVGLFDLVDGVPRVAEVRRSFDGLSAGALQRGRWTAWYEGVATIESARVDSKRALHAFRVEAPGMMAQVYLDRHGSWARLEALGDQVPGLILESDRWDRLVSVPSRPTPPQVAGDTPVEFTDALGHAASGLLVVPAREPAPPVVLFLWGSGPHDANGDGRKGAPPHGAPLLDLVRALTGQGVASLRLAESRDPGTKGSRPLSAREATAVAALEFLREQPGLDPLRVAVVGHSEGCLVAARLAATQELAASVWLAAPSRSLIELLPEQTARILRLQGAGEDYVQSALGSLEQFLAALPKTEKDGTAPAAESGWWNLGGLRWWLEHRALRPVDLAAGVLEPVLLVHGDRDCNVPFAQAEDWRRAFEVGANPRVTMQRVPGADHFLVPNPSGDPMRSAEADRSMDPRAVAMIQQWLRETLGEDLP